MRKLFLLTTAAFWAAVVAFALASTGEPKAPASPSVATSQRTAPEKRYSIAEVARHAVETDCWMAIDGVVYDFTAYLPEHPSRPSIILPWCGKEASEAYRTKTKGRPHSPEADQQLPAYRIGVLTQP